jgi:protein-disulfide isomerase
MENKENNNVEVKMDTADTSDSVVNTKDNNQKQIAGAIVFAGLLIAGAILIKGGVPSKAPVQALNGAGAPEKVELSPITTQDHITGNPNAKIVVVEYSDLECPFCKVFHKTMHQVIETNKNVAWVYRHYPIPQLHSKAQKEAEATECVWEQGGNTAFWQYADKIFETTTSNDSLDPAKLPEIAGALGFDVTSFKTCLESGRYESKVQASIDGGNKSGVRGTPKSFIVKNGKVVDVIDGAQSIDTVKKQIEKALK